MRVALDDRCNARAQYVLHWVGWTHMREVVSQATKLLVYLRAVCMRTRVSSRWPFLLPGCLRCRRLGGGRSSRRNGSNGLQEMRLRTIDESVLIVTGGATKSNGLTLVNGIVDR